MLLVHYFETNPRIPRNMWAASVCILSPTQDDYNEYQQSVNRPVN